MSLVEFEGAGVRLAADVSGPEDGKPVVFLHGGGQTRGSWGKALSAVAQRGYRGISLDLRGHGESGWSPDGDYGIERYAEDVGAVVGALGKPPILVGASLGGLASLVAVGEMKAPAAGLVLVDVAPRIGSTGASKIGAFMNSAPNGFASLDEAADAVSAYLPHRPRPKNTSGLMKNLRLRDDGRLHWHWDPAFLKSVRPDALAHRDRLEAAARGLTLPTLLIRGGLSEVVSPESARDFLALVPHAEFVDVAGADHMVAGDANDAFNSAVLDFIDRHA